MGSFLRDALARCFVCAPAAAAAAAGDGEEADANGPEPGTSTGAPGRKSVRWSERAPGAGEPPPGDEEDSDGDEDEDEDDSGGGGRRPGAGSGSGTVAKSKASIFHNERTRKMVSPLLAAIRLLEVIEEHESEVGSIDIEDVRLLKSFLTVDNADESSLFYPITKSSISKHHTKFLQRLSSLGSNESEAHSGSGGSSAEREAALNESLSAQPAGGARASPAASADPDAFSEIDLSRTSTSSSTSDDVDFYALHGVDEDSMLARFTDRRFGRRSGAMPRSASCDVGMSTSLLTRTMTWRRRATMSRAEKQIQERVLSEMLRLDGAGRADLDTGVESLRRRTRATSVSEFTPRERWIKAYHDATFTAFKRRKMKPGDEDAFPTAGHIKYYLRYLLPGVEHCCAADETLPATAEEEGGARTPEAAGGEAGARDLRALTLPKGGRCGSERAADADADESPRRRGERVRRLSRMLQTCDRVDWEYDVFELDALTGGHGLSTLLFVVFEKSGLIRHYKLHVTRLRDFAVEVEARMSANDVAYHNRKHVSCFLQTLFAQLSDEKGCGSLFSHPIEWLGLIYGAAVHDIDHPGLTNDYLVKTGHEWAILYNDHSVAENHHATAAFMMLRSASAARRLDAAAPAADVNFIGAQLTTEDFRRFRYIVCECILATDMRSHFSIIGNVQVLCLRFENEGRLHGQEEGAERGGLWRGIKEKNDENDYLTVMKLLMKLSDLAHLALRRDLMLRWVDMLREEFFSQGDREREAAIPVSFMMDRNKELELYDAQPGFFEAIALPLFSFYNDIFPGGSSAPMLKQLQRNLRYWRKRVKGKTGSPP